MGGVTMSSIAGVLMAMGAATFFAGLPTVAAAQTVSAEEAIETAREVYRVPEQTVSLCPEDAVEEAVAGAQGNVIVVCRQLGGPYEFQTRDGPRPDLGRTATGAPRAPDVSTIPPCGSVAGGVGIATCSRFGSVPPPAIMVDTTAFPEPLSAEDAARVFRADEGERRTAPITGERVSID